jgi:hypothetical protein
MLNQYRYYLLILLIFCLSCTDTKTKNETNQKHFPDLDEISGKWVAADTVAMEPSIRNFRGQAVVNRDLTSISWFASAPFSGGYHTGVFKINGEIPLASMFRWQPYQTLRKSQWKDYELVSSTRMLPEEDGILWRIEIHNTGQTTDTLDINLDAIGFISKYEGEWQWWYPFPKMNGMVTNRDEEVEAVRKNIGISQTKEVIIDELVEGKPTGKKMSVRVPLDADILNATKYKAQKSGNSIIVHDSETDAVTGFTFRTIPDSLKVFNSGGTAHWRLPISAGESKVIEYAMTYGDRESVVKENLASWSSNFDQKFDHVKTVWETRWEQMFQPKNELLSGTFPVLETTDSLVKRVYYTGPLTMLYLMNTNMPQYKRVILTGGPKWGASISFFWDNTEWSFIQALSDPARLKDNIILWLQVDPSKNYGFDNFSGKGVGNAYSANYYALFQLIRSYVVITKDYNFLNEKVNNKTILETLEQYATNGEKISCYGKPGCADDIYKLADFGDDEWNLLECVPTYKHIVPSFNATYIWMMRETAKFYAYINNSTKAEELNKKADEMIPRLMKLYAGDGVWNCLYPNNQKVEVRHVMDFIYTGRFIPQDIPETMRKEMIDFVYRELMTAHWMRAQSLQDIAAKNSDRPDHGPLGAFDGWPAATMDALVQFGDSQKALDFYRSMEPLTHEGSWAQAHELWGENKNNSKARVRIAERGWHARDAIAGIGMSQVLVKCFFGLNPDIKGDPIRKASPLNLNAKLHHVLYGGEYYTMELKEGDVRMEKEGVTLRN